MDPITAPMPQPAPGAVRLDPALAAEVDAQVDGFLAGLVGEPVDGEGFRRRLDAAFRLGREEIAATTALLQGRLIERRFAGFEDSPAFDAIGRLRSELETLRPGPAARLLSPRRLFGLIPFGRHVDEWLRRYRGAGPELNEALREVYAAREDLEQDLAAVVALDARLAEADLRLAAALRFIERLDATLSARLEDLGAGDPARARAIEQEVLFPVRQNRQDVLTQRAVAAQARLALDALRRTGRELVNGCTRVATTGISALAAAQAVAVATAGQARVAAALEGIGGALDQLVADTGRELEAHVARTTAFAGRPLVAIERLAAAFEQSFRAIAALDEYRGKALATLAENNAALAAQVERAGALLERERRGLAAAGAARGAGPVAL